MGQKCSIGMTGIFDHKISMKIMRDFYDCRCGEKTLNTRSQCDQMLGKIAKFFSKYDQKVATAVCT